MKQNVVVAITGASGVTYAIRLLEVLSAAGCDVHLTMSMAGQAVLKKELDLTVDLENFSPSMLMLDTGQNLKDHQTANHPRHGRDFQRCQQRVGRGLGRRRGYSITITIAIIWRPSPAARF